MQIRHYLLKYALICIHLKKTKSEYWIKPGSKFFFHCVHILDEKKITEGFMDIYFCYPVNQNILSVALKK